MAGKASGFVLTEFHAVESKVEAREYHLTQSKPGAKGGEEADGKDGEDVDEEDGQKRIDETKIENRDGQGTDGERGDDHVRSTPLFTHCVRLC